MEIVWACESGTSELDLISFHLQDDNMSLRVLHRKQSDYHYLDVSVCFLRRRFVGVAYKLSISFALLLPFRPNWW